jgi:hypothetical protein
MVFNKGVEGQTNSLTMPVCFSPHPETETSHSSEGMPEGINNVGVRVLLLIKVELVQVVFH